MAEDGGLLLQLLELETIINAAEDAARADDGTGPPVWDAEEVGEWA